MYATAFLEFPAEDEDKSPVRRRCTIGPETPLNQLLKHDSYRPELVQAALRNSAAPQ